MKLNSLPKVNIFKKMSQCKLLLQCSATPVVEQAVWMTTSSLPKKEKVLFAPALTNSSLQALNDITGVAVAANNVSWAKISIPNFALLEWNSYALPSEFKTDLDDANILSLASSICQSIPNSDMYLVENCSFKALAFREHILRTAILVLLNCLDRDVKVPSKVVFQKPVILNTLCNIIVGAERTSANRIVKKILNLPKFWEYELSDDAKKSESSPECFSIININEQQKQAFFCCDLAKQESLSLALLVALTFSEIKIIKNSDSISKIHDKLSTKYKKVSSKTVQKH